MFYNIPFAINDTVIKLLCVKIMITLKVSNLNQYLCDVFIPTELCVLEEQKGLLYQRGLSGVFQNFADMLCSVYVYID
jgi:hypothetical protein